MIVKFLGNKGGGSAGATIDYMLGKDRDREGAILLSGDPDLTARIADNLDFKNRYTVGVLSFEESDLEEHQKQEIMQSFEKTLLAGLERDQYDITWIEHRDKGRLELNFIIPNVELSTGKRLQPYYDKADRPLVENWKQVTNFEYGLSDPHAPEKRQSISIQNSLPKDKKELVTEITESLFDEIKRGAVTDRKDVINHLENLGLEVARVTPTAISIKAPDGGRNIRLKGEVYADDFRFNERYSEEKARQGTEHFGAGRERYETALERKTSLVDKREQRNREYYKGKSTGNSARIDGHTQDYIERNTGNSGGNKAAWAFQYAQGDNLGGNRVNNIDIGSRDSVAGQGNQRQTAGTRRIEPTNRANAFREADFKGSGISRGQGQQNLFHRGQEKQRGFNNQKITNPFDNPFNHGLGDGEVLQRTELLKQPQTTAQAQQTVQPQESEHAKRLHEQLQRHLEHVGKSVERAKRNQSESGETDREIDRAEQRISKFNGIIEHGASRNIEHEREIKQSEQTFNAASRGIIETEQHISERAIRQEKLEKQQSGIVKGR